MFTQSSRSVRNVTGENIARDPVQSRSKCRKKSCALESLYRSEHRRVLAFLTCIIGTEHAPDLAQEVFLRVARRTDLSSLHNPSHYLHRVARNIAIDFVRSSKRSIATVPLAEDCEASCRPEQDDGISVRDTSRLVRSELAGMPDQTARIFIMNRFERKTYREIQLELGIALPTVDYHMMKALRRLRDAVHHETK